MRGFTLIDVLVGSFLMLIVFWGIVGVFYFGIKVVYQSKARVEATAIAKGEIEKIRNLPYSSIGVAGSFPDGDLEGQTTIIRNQVNYQIERRVDFVVDSLDGIASPVDECPNDYKKVEIKISWQDKFPGELKLVTDVTPDSLAQECEEIGGILLVSAFDSLGQMITFPLIEIKEPTTDTVLKSVSPDDGEHYFTLEPGTYKIEVSKSGYNSERTYGTDEIAIPEKPHPVVLESQVTEISFSIDRISSMTVEARGTKGSGYPVIHNVTFNLRGSKIIGYDSQENPVYKYSQNQTTDGAGSVSLSNLEWDSYYFSIVNPDLDLIEVEFPPGTTTTQPIDLLPNTSQQVRLILRAENSLLINVENQETLEPIFSAAVRMYNNELGYDKTQYTDEKGQTYFIPLASATYNLEVQASGYSSFSGTVSVAGDTTQTISLERIE